MRIDRKKLAGRMIDLDINQTSLAKEAGVSRATVTAVATGKSCSPITAGKIAKALGVSVAELVEERR